jgi:hypothetical protein
MPDNDRDTRNVVPAPPSSVPTSIPLVPTTHIDLGWMPEDQRRALLTEYTRNTLNLSAKAVELGIEVNDLRAKLDSLANATQALSDKGNAVTATLVHNSTAGRIEVNMGNTLTAWKGRMSRSQTGEFNWIPVYIIGGVIAVIIVISMFVHH